MCSALCNESVLQYNPDKRNYEKIGESTEVALRVLAEKVILICLSQNLQLIFLSWNCVVLRFSFHNFGCQIGLPGYDSMPSALNMLSKHERASYCNRYWDNQFKKVCCWISYFLHSQWTKGFMHNRSSVFIFEVILWSSFFSLRIWSLQLNVDIMYFYFNLYSS